VSILYAYYADDRLDAETIAHRLRQNPELRKSAMTTAEKLIAKGHTKGWEEGRAKGREEGRLQGEWIGQIRSLERLMNLPLSTMSELGSSSSADLEARFVRLQKEYDARFKNC
jgi:hypothetical protein